MKIRITTCLLLVAIFIAGALKVQAQFPEWSYQGEGDELVWVGVDWGLMDPDWKSKIKADNKQTLELSFYGDYDISSQSVSEVWDLVSSPAIAVDKYLEATDDDGNVTKRLPNNAEDFTAEIKGFFDEENVYVLAKVTDNEILPGAEAIELMWASYKDSLPVDLWPFTPTKTTADNEHIIARWGQRGAGKALATLDFVEEIGIAVEGGFYFKENDDGVWEHAWEAPDWKEGLGMQVAQFKQTSNTTYEVVWAFNIEKTLGGYVTPEKDNMFSFDFKIIDKDTVSNKGSDIEALFSSTANEVWWSTFYAGYAKFMEDIPTAIRVHNLKGIEVYPNPTTEILNITGELAELKVFNMLGKEVKSLKNVKNRVQLGDLEKGMYLIQMTDYKNNVGVQKILVQ